MHRIYLAFGLCGLLFAFPWLHGQQIEKDAGNRQAGQSGDPARPETVAGAGKSSGADTRRNAHVRLLRNNAPAAARVSITGSDGKPYGPADAAMRKTKRGESYFYAHNSFDVE